MIHCFICSQHIMDFTFSSPGWLGWNSIWARSFWIMGVILSMSSQAASDTPVSTLRSITAPLTFVSRRPLVQPCPGPCEMSSSMRLNKCRYQQRWNYGQPSRSFPRNHTLDEVNIGKDATAVNLDPGQFPGITPWMRSIGKDATAVNLDSGHLLGITPWMRSNQKPHCMNARGTVLNHQSIWIW